jgi:hypothetical protein
LDDLFPPLVLEVHIDIGRFVAFFGKETGKKQVGFIRGDGSNTKHKANRRVSGRASALAKDICFRAQRHIIFDGQKIIGVSSSAMISSSSLMALTTFSGILSP